MVGWFLLATAGVLMLASRVPGLGLTLDPWLSRRQKQRLRELHGRQPLSDAEFIDRMQVATVDIVTVEKVRQAVADGATYLLRNRVTSSLIYPQDQIVDDLGIGVGPDLEDTAIITTLERNLGISLSDQETEAVRTVEELVHTCARKRERSRFHATETT